MPHVRAAVNEALHTAKLLASGDPIRTTIGFTESPIRKTAERGRSTSNGDTVMSPMSKRVASPTSQESHHLSFSPASTSTSESMHHVQVPSPAASAGRRAKRAPLFPARGMGFTHSPMSTTTTSPSSSTTSDSETHLRGRESLCPHCKVMNFQCYEDRSLLFFIQFEFFLCMVFLLLLLDTRHMRY